MRKIGMAGLALALVGALVFGAGFIGARGDLSVVNGSIGPFRVQLANGHVHSGFSYTDSSPKGDSSQNGIGGGRNKPVTTPQPVPTPTPRTDTGSGHHDEQHHTDSADCQSFAAEDVREIELDINYADVHVLPSFDGKVNVSCGDLDDYRISLDKNGVLSVENRDKVTIWGLNLTGDRPELTVTLPRELGCSLEVDNSCGNIKVEKLDLGEMELDTDMGDVRVKNMQCLKAELSTSCGDITVLNLTCSGDVSLESDMGYVFAQNCEAIGKIQAESSCGNVNVIGCTAADAELSSDMGNVNASGLDCARSVKLDCDCGTISFYGLSAKTIEIDNSMGSIEGTLPGSISDYSIESGTDLGSNNLPSKLELGDIKLKVNDSCGSIDVNFLQDN